MRLFAHISVEETIALSVSHAWRFFDSFPKYIFYIYLMRFLSRISFLRRYHCKWSVITILKPLLLESSVIIKILNLIIFLII